MKKIDSGQGATAYTPPPDFVPNVSDIGPVNDAHFAAKETHGLLSIDPTTDRRLDDLEKRVKALEDRK